MLIRHLTRSDIEGVRELGVLAATEGFRFLSRLIEELEQGSAKTDHPCEFFLCAVEDGKILGVAGVTIDPYTDAPGVGRIRHLYVQPESRRSGIGRALIREIEGRVKNGYSILRLRTDTEAGARFYEALGYRPVNETAATHVRSDV